MIYYNKYEQIWKPNTAFYHYSHIIHRYALIFFIDMIQLEC